LAGKGIDKPEEKTAILVIRVTPRAKRDEIGQLMEDGTIKVRLTAPPVEGKANDALLKFLAQVFHIPVNRLKLLSGITGRNKRVQVEGLNAEEAWERVQEFVNR
jgi:uncharacterized protein (TIGR00251 family)